jgi:hypothetical protein
MFKSLTLFSVSIFIFCLNARSEAQGQSPDDFTAMIEQALQEVAAEEEAAAQGAQETVTQGITIRVLDAPRAEIAPESAATPNVEIAAVNFEPIPENFFDYAKYNELRNVRDYDSDANKPYDINGTSGRILNAIEENPFRFTGFNDLRFFAGRSDIAPTGSAGYNDEGQRVFQIANRRDDRRRNAIISVYYENIQEVSAIKYPQSGAIQDVYRADLLLLSHLEDRGAFFTKVRVELDWSDFAGDDKGYVNVISEPRHISLSETDFEVYVDLGKQKTILKDKSEHDITIVFAITTGGFDNRSSVDGVVGSLSLQMPRNLVSQAQLNENPELEYQDFDKETSFLVKRSRWSNHRVNTETRTAPYFFNGRPFISIIDTRFLTRDENGELPANLHGGYRLVGFHDKIESDGLIRAPYSNGCLRTPDPDLYALDAIINHGPKDMIPVSAKMSQPEFADLEPILPRQNLYRQTRLQVRDGSPNNARTVDCGPSTSNYTVKFYRGNDGRQYQTMVSSSCLTGMATVNESSERIVEYIIDKSENGRASFQAPASSIAAINELHTSIQSRKEILLRPENIERIAFLRPQFQTFAYGRATLDFRTFDPYLADYSLQAQRDKISLVAELESGEAPGVLVAQNFQFAPLDQIYFTLSQNLNRVRRQDRDTFRINVPWYTQNCANNPTPDHRCGRALTTLQNALSRVGGLF